MKDKYYMHTYWGGLYLVVRTAQDLGIVIKTIKHGDIMKDLLPHGNYNWSLLTVKCRNIEHHSKLLEALYEKS